MDRLERAIICNLHAIPGLGNRSLFKIREAFDSFQAFYHASQNAQYGLLGDASVTEYIKEKRRLDPEVLIRLYDSHDIRVTCWDEPEYPENLRNISNPPFVLYYKGELEITERPCLSIVGSRVATAYGRAMARKFAKELAAAGMVIVSGMARGIDSEAHRGALEYGKTVAVLGSGLDVIYPPENKGLFEDITKSGVVLSEFPLHTAPEQHNFPLRNRLISGLSRGVLIVEAKAKSGALITADFALEQGKDVFALPGPVNSKTSDGTNNLIKQGAKLVTGIEDIMEEYYDINQNCGIVEQGELAWLDEGEQRIVDLIGYQTLHLDEILQGSGLDLGGLSALLFKLEFKGIIKSLPGNYYVRI